MLGQIKPVEPATFQELFEVSDANFYRVIRDTPLIIVGPLTEQDEDKRAFPWVVSRDGKPLFGAFDHSFEIAPGRTREEVFLGMIDYTVKCMEREKLDVKVARDLAEMNDMIVALWPDTNLGQLIQDWMDRIQKMEAAAKRTRRGDLARRRTRMPIEAIEAALQAALNQPSESQCECEACAQSDMGEDEFGAEIEATVKEHGHMIIMTETEKRVPMAYTVGLAEAGLPELVCFGLQPKDAYVLNPAADLLRKGELPLDTPFKGFTKQALVFKAVPPERGVGYVNWANARAGLPVNLIQMVWPDKEGQYPWSAKFDNCFRAQQPCLFPAAN